MSREPSPVNELHTNELQARSSEAARRVAQPDPVAPEDGLDLDVDADPPFEEEAEDDDRELAGSDIIMAVARPNMQQPIGIAYYNETVGSFIISLDAT